MDAPSRIEQLSAHVVNKIAAGEVIERPASVVKELVENALDAGATRVDVTLHKGGTELIRVADNGHGMGRHELPLAISSHATSKIRSDDDLFSVQTLGFRGEALASIAAVSRFRLESRPVDRDEGHVIQVVGGEVQPIEPCGGPVGTRVEVNDLFFNTPVRRKFLRTTQTEMGHVTEAITRLALAFPHVHFVLRHQDRVLHDLPPTDRWRERIAAFFGNELTEHLLCVEHQDEQVRLFGMVADPSYTRANPRMQYMFLNRRHIKDRSLQHALAESYRGLIMVGRYPIAFLQLEMLPELVDVNVHPTKLEVRFQDGGRVYSQLLGTLRNKFLTTDLTKFVAMEDRADSVDAGSHDVGVSSSGSDQKTAAGSDADVPHRDGRSRDHQLSLTTTRIDGAESHPSPTAAQRDDVRQWVAGLESRNSEARFRSSSDMSGGSDVATPRLSDTGDALGDRGNVVDIGHGTDTDRVVSSVAMENQSPNMPCHGGGDVEADASPPAVPRGLQIHDRYLVCESPEGIVVIDQHALHERILYEELRDRVESGKLERQTLLVPESVSLTAEEAAALLEVKSVLCDLGVVVEEFGGSTLLVSAYPSILRTFRPDKMLREIAERLLTGKQQLSHDDVLDQLLHTMACKGAVKAGDRLTHEEVTALLAQRHLVHDSHHCPHGRPTTLVFRCAELDRHFGRT